MTARRSRPFFYLGATTVLAACGGGDKSAANDPNLVPVVRADLPITVKENAELQAVRETIIRSELEGQATVIWLAAEGSTVKQGDTLVKLDVSDIVEKRASQAIAVAKAEAALTQARKALEILQKDQTTKRNTAASNQRIAELEFEKYLGKLGDHKGAEGTNADMVKKLRDLVSESGKAVADASASGATAAKAPQSLIAQIEPGNYTGLVARVHELMDDAGDGNSALDRSMGEMANKVLNQVDQIKLAMADLKVKEDTFQKSKGLAEKSFITKNELDRDNLAFQSQASKVTLSWNDLDLLINYSLQKDLIKLRQDRDNTRLTFESVVASNENEQTRADSELKSKQAEYDLAKERLDHFDRQIIHGVITAPTPGLVVYARIERNMRGGDAVKEGTQVRERQDLIILPDTTRMRAQVKVQEAQIDKVQKGQPAYITVEAQATNTFTGRVASVAPVADSSNSWMGNDRKVYTTIIDLDGENTDGSLRTRMAAAATIVIGTVKDTLPVPLQAVRRDRSVNYVWRRTEQGPVAVPVKVGQHNAEKVEVLDGLAAGDMILLTPPGGIAEPRFPQPEVPTLTPGPATDSKDTPAAGKGDKPPRADGQGEGDKPRRQPNPELQALMAELRSWLLQKYPDRAAEFEGNATFRALMDPAIQEAMQAEKPELAQKLQDLRSRMPGPGGRGRNGGNAGAANGDGGPVHDGNRDHK